jgi:hypothetical protein
MIGTKWSSDLTNAECEPKARRTRSWTHCYLWQMRPEAKLDSKTRRIDSQMSAHDPESVDGDQVAESRAERRSITWRRRLSELNASAPKLIINAVQRRFTIDLSASAALYSEYCRRRSLKSTMTRSQLPSRPRSFRHYRSWADTRQLGRFEEHPPPYRRDAAAVV